MSLAFVIDRKLLADELAIICRAIEGKTTIPVLTHVVIEGLENGTIKLTGTNLDIGMTSIIHPLKLATTGAITLPGRTLLNTLRKLPGTNVAFLEQEGFKTALICDQATVTLNGMSRESFPELPVCKSTAALAVYSTDLLRLISRTRYAICKKESSFTLNGAAFTAAVAISRYVVSFPPAMVTIPRGSDVIWCSRETCDSGTPSVLISGRTPAQVPMTSSRRSPTDGNVAFAVSSR